MEPATQAVPGYYVWEIPGKHVAVHLHLDVVDRLLAEVMRGFAAIPKRGAEVGGVLLGTIEQGDPAIVRVEDFDPVACAYKRGPSYLLAEEDAEAFAEVLERWAPEAPNPAYAVGYFRSHTRDGLALSAEDTELLDRHFPEPSHVALLIKPYATKVSMAGFFFREGGVFQKHTPLEFPFRRREMTGEQAPRNRSMTQRRPRTRELRRAEPAAIVESADDDYATAEPQWAPEPAGAVTVRAPARSRLPRGWVWVPLSFIFLFLGMVLGFQAARSMSSKAMSSAAANEFSLSLAVAKSGETLSVKWDRQAPVIRGAQRGLLQIEDGSYSKSVDLNQAQLQYGSIIYRNSSNSVRFRLVVYPKASVSVTETMEWRQ